MNKHAYEFGTYSKSPYVTAHK